MDARGIITSARGNGLRVSFHAYNNEQDVDAVLAAVDAESAFVERARDTVGYPRDSTGTC
jgi:selenocysteine lyase/cysteine desulfurase